MDKMKMESPDGVQINIESIGRLFPSVITESRGDDGRLKKSVDFEKLKQLLSEDIAEGNEAYEFTWVGKKEAVAEAGRPIRKTLRPCIEESKNWEETENLYIEGDNLEVLKLLQESYLGQVKMIYIDPPYNTGKDFVYKDNFRKSKEDYEEEAGVYDEDENKLFQNTESNGRFHSDWCSMIYPRLMLARNLLKEDGVIFISIDHNELAALKLISNQVFGESNYLGEIIWQTATDNNPSQISMEHEYILCYAKDKSRQNKWTTESEKANLINKKYKELCNEFSDLEIVQKELKKWMKLNEKNLKGVSHYSYIDSIGVYYPGNSSNTKPGGYKFDIVHPKTKKVCKKPDYGYRWTEKTFWDADKRGDVEWGVDETTIPKIKKRIETVTEMLKSYYYEDNRTWTKYINSLMGSKVFDNPKSVNLLKHLMKFTSDPSSIILDFFSGSATTAHAVMQLNAEDGGNRKYIMVQLPEETPEKSEARKAGYDNICEIGKERIRRAGDKIAEDNSDSDGIDSLDIGFRVFKLDESNMKDVYYSAGEYSQGMLDDLISNIKEDRTDADLLYACLLEWGLPLSLPHLSEQIGGFKVHTVNGGDLAACFENGISEDVVRKIAEKQPLRAVFRDSSFADSPSKINVEEIFKLLSPSTSVKVI